MSASPRNYPHEGLEAVEMTVVGSRRDSGGGRILSQAPAPTPMQTIDNRLSTRAPDPL